MDRNRRKRIVIGITMFIGGAVFAFAVRCFAIMQMIEALSPDRLQAGLPVVDGTWLEISEWGTILGMIVAGLGAVLAYVEWARGFIASAPARATPADGVLRR